MKSQDCLGGPLSSLYLSEYSYACCAVYTVKTKGFLVRKGRTWEEWGSFNPDRLEVSNAIVLLSNSTLFSVFCLHLIPPILFSSLPLTCTCINMQLAIPSMYVVQIFCKYIFILMDIYENI